jgi:Zinc carboxypeptidase
VIDVAEVLNALPEFNAFCSVQQLQKLSEQLPAGSSRFRSEVVGTSVNGLPIHHIRFGKGSVKVLLVGFPHPNEPVGGLTVFALLSLLSQGHPQLTTADVEWHLVPCIDPDGALLNEGWSQQAFTLERYMRNFHRQELRDQVECSFPIKHKRLEFNEPIPETRILQKLIEKIRPDFYYPLHNSAGAGGAWYSLNRDIDRCYYDQLHRLLAEHRIPLQGSAPFGTCFAQFAPGIWELYSTSRFYDCMEETTPDPQKVLKTGACSWEYLTEIKPGAVTFVTELPYIKHPSDGSPTPAPGHIRQLKLRMDADNKFLATMILQEWDRLKEDLNEASPFYRKIVQGVIAARDDLIEGLPSWPYKTRDILFSPVYDTPLTKGLRFDVFLLDRFFVLCHSYEFVRLLKVSRQTPAVRGAIQRLDAVFDEALADVANSVDADAFEVIGHEALARVQLGSGLIVLNSVLEAHKRSVADRLRESI